MLWAIGAVAAQADVCVWRNPEKTMGIIFHQAKDYRTIDKKIAPEKREIIEKWLGDKLAPGEREDWTYYEISGKGSERLGYIIADAEKGEFGVIEMVVGITPDRKIQGIYIQRAREKNKEFKSKEFLEQFKGKSINDPLEIGKDVQVKENSLPARMTLLGVRKMLILYEQLSNHNQ